MQTQLYITNRVEYSIDACGVLEAYDAVDPGVCEGAFHMSEEFTPKQCFGHGAGVDGDHQARRTLRDRMQGPRHNLFSRAVLAGDQDMRVGRSNAGYGLEDGLHERGRGNELGTSLSLQQAILRGKPLGALQCSAQVNLGPEDSQQPLVLPWLLDEVTGPTAHGLHCQLDVRPRGHDNDGS